MLGLKLIHASKRGPWSDLTVYRQIYNITRTKSQNLNVSRIVLQLSLPNLLKPCIKLRMNM